jgi:acyl-lipid omega-6 desaturase (Delta-12 desaturase)
MHCHNIFSFNPFFMKQSPVHTPPQTAATDSLQYIMQHWQEIVKPYQVPNTRLAIVQMLTSFLPFLALWVLMYFSLQVSYLLTIAMAFLNAFFVVRIFIIQHDCGHQSFLGSKKWNDTIGFMCSFFSLIPYRYWAKSHSFHHGHNGQLEEEVRDIGELNVLTVEEYSKLSFWGKFGYRIYRMPIILFGFGSLYYILIHNRLPLIKQKGFEFAKKSLVLSNLAIIAFYTVLILLLGVKTFLKIQIPIIIFFGLIAVWFFYVQHQHEHAYRQWKDNWHYVMSAIKGSTYYKLPRIVQWLTGNIGLHHIHHLSSLIPNYNLEKCKNENPILQEHVTIIGFWASLKFMFHKLWDEQQQRMITFREYSKMSKK